MKSTLKFLGLALVLTGCGAQTQTTSNSSVAAAPTASHFVYTSTPDNYARTNITKAFPGMSDTGKYQITSCSRRINEPTHIQVVCKGKVEVLMFGGHIIADNAACRYDFNLKANGKYLTTKSPECTK